MSTEAPSSFNQHIFFKPDSVYYGTDDGYQDGSFGEFGRFLEFYESVPQSRRDNIHFVSAVGGLYGLNLMTAFRPKRITFFDISPHAINYFRAVRCAFAASRSRADLLARLSSGDYGIAASELDPETAEFYRENLRLKQAGTLPASRGSAYKRTLEVSWKYALEHFDLTRALLLEAPLELRTEGIESESFAELLRTGRNIWLYSSNIVEFTYSRLPFGHPENAAVVSIVYPGQAELLDLAPFGDQPVEVRCEIPLSALALDDDIVGDDPPSPEPDTVGRALAGICRDQLSLGPDSRVLDVGCGWGRLGLALMDTLDPERGIYEGFDPHRANIMWAQSHIMRRHGSYAFHIANIRNAIYKPDGRLDPECFSFPWAEGAFGHVVMHAVLPYLTSATLENYLRQSARVLESGGRLLLSGYLLDDAGLPDAVTGPGPATRSAPRFRFTDGPVVSSEPRGAGLKAWDRAHLQEVLGANGFDVASVAAGRWRGGSRDEPVLDEDVLVAIKR